MVALNTLSVSPMYLGRIPRPAFGIRVPEVVLEPILEAVKDVGSFVTLMLSYNRETAPSRIIESRDPKYMYLGHTGTSIKSYISNARSKANQIGVPVEIEADHVSLMKSAERAIKRIAGAGFEAGLSEEDIRFSLSYIEEELKEAKEAGGVDFVTLDTCELIDLSVDKLSDKELLSRYENEIDLDVRRDLERRYLGRRFVLATRNCVVAIKFSKELIARCALKYLKSIEYCVKLASVVEETLGSKVGIEIAFDEVPHETKEEELLFYLNELRVRGLDVDFVAPNVGFRKREDYDKPLSKLYVKLRRLYTVASSMGCYISIHSGSGAHPYSDKGFGVWHVVREATDGMVKYKMSGVLIQLALEVMSRFPSGSLPRKVYEEIYDAVIDHLRKVVVEKSALYSKELEEMLNRYKGDRNPRADVFRHYFFVFQCLRDENGRRWLRDRFVEAFEKSSELRELYRKEVKELVYRLCRALGYEGSVYRYTL